MSAFIVSKETMDHVVTMINTDRGIQPLGEARLFGNMPIVTDDDLSALGRALYAVNLDAVTQRYHQDTKETAPGPCDISDIHENYRFAYRDISQSQGYKSVGCLLYQCSEGDVPESSQLFKALDALHDRLAHKVAQEVPEYVESVWDT